MAIMPSLHRASLMRHTPHVINVREPRQFDDWCRQFAVTPLELATAVSLVGGNPDVVLRYLKHRTFA